MIVGTGIDIVYIPRIQTVWQKYGIKFLTRVYSKQEIEDSRKYSNYQMQIKHFAKRFAAKEAFAKALGIGFSCGIKMQDIEVCNDKNGKPSIALKNGAFNFLSQNKVTHISLSDDKDYAIASVIITLDL